MNEVEQEINLLKSKLGKQKFEGKSRQEIDNALEASIFVLEHGLSEGEVRGIYENGDDFSLAAALTASAWFFQEKDAKKPSDCWPV